MIRKYGFAKLLGAVVTLLVWTFAAHAQTDHRGTINGTVSSSTGATLSNVAVQLRNVDTADTREAMTDSSGKYTFSDVEAGRYRMTTRQNGIPSAPSDEVTVTPGDIATVNLTVTISVINRTPATTSPVTSVEIAPAVEELNGPRIQNGFTTTQLEYLPSAAYLSPGGEQFGAYNLSLLGAGVASNGGVGPGRGPVVGGQRPIANNFYIDGVDNNLHSNPGQLVAVSNEAGETFVAFQNHFPPNLDTLPAASSTP